MLWGSRMYRALLVVCLLVLVFPQSVFATPSPAVSLAFEVIAVKREVSVTIRTKDFPQKTKFTALMQVAGKKSKTAIPVGELDSGQGGVIEKTFQIPADLQDRLILGLYLESADGYTAYNWFFNDDLLIKLQDPNAKVKPEVSFSETKKGASTTIEAKNLPANAPLWVRIGPYDGFYSKYTALETVNTGADGTVKFPVQLPASLKNVEYIMVRLDGAGTYAYNIYQNVDGGKAVPLTQVNKVKECQIVSLNPIPALKPREDFDVIWVVQNTGLSDWEKEHVIFKFIGGEPMHKYKDVQTLNADILRGAVHEFVVDMRAPEQPGWYTAVWMVKRAAEPQKDLCRLSVRVAVEQ